MCEFLSLVFRLQKQNGDPETKRLVRLLLKRVEKRIIISFDLKKLSARFSSRSFVSLLIVEVPRVWNPLRLRVVVVG